MTLMRKKQNKKKAIEEKLIPGEISSGDSKSSKGDRLREGNLA